MFSPEIPTTDPQANSRTAERRHPWPTRSGANPAEARQWWAAKRWLERQPGFVSGYFVKSVHEHGFWYDGPIFCPQHVSWERLRRYEN